MSAVKFSEGIDGAADLRIKQFVFAGFAITTTCCRNSGFKDIVAIAALSQWCGPSTPYYVMRYEKRKFVYAAK